jgi:hypothetical protein
MVEMKRPQGGLGGAPPPSAGPAPEHWAELARAEAQFRILLRDSPFHLVAAIGRVWADADKAGRRKAASLLARLDPDAPGRTAEQAGLLRAVRDEARAASAAGRDMDGALLAASLEPARAASRALREPVGLPRLDGEPAPAAAATRARGDDGPRHVAWMFATLPRGTRRDLGRLGRRTAERLHAAGITAGGGVPGRVREPLAADTVERARAEAVISRAPVGPPAPSARGPGDGPRTGRPTGRGGRDRGGGIEP